MEFNWDAGNLVDPHLTPSRISSVSCAFSTFIDLGAAVLRPPIQSQQPPLFEAFEGTDPEGWVITQNGWVMNAHLPGHNDIAVDAPDLGLANFIPEDENSVRVEFQGANAVAPGSGIPDMDTLTEWSPDPGVANGMRFIRFKITLNVAVGTLSPTPKSPRPQVNHVRLRLTY